MSIAAFMVLICQRNIWRLKSILSFINFLLTDNDMAIFYNSSLHLKLNSQSTLLKANFPMITVGSLFRIRTERMESKHLDRSNDLCGSVDGALIHAAIMLNLHSSSISVLSRNCGFAFRYSIIWVPLFGSDIPLHHWPVKATYTK